VSYGTRSIAGELTRLIDKKITVRLVDGKTYSGRLLSLDPASFHLVLGDVEGDESSRFYRVVINGNRVSEILVQEQPLFDAEEFTSYLVSKLNLRPFDVKVLREANAVIVYDRYKVSEAGVEGSGPTAERIYEVYQEYLEQKKRGAK